MKFRFKHSLTVIILTGLTVALSLFSIIWNIITVVKISPAVFSTVILNYLMIVISALLLIFGTGILLFSYYKIDGKKIIVKFGLIKSNVLLENIAKIIEYTDEKKLIIYLKNGEYTVIVINQKYFKKFVADILNIAPNIYFTFLSNKDLDAE